MLQSNRLFYNRVYLSGPIDNAKDFGTGWRNRVKSSLFDLDFIFLDPCDKPMQPGFACEDLENHNRRKELKRIGDWETVSREMRLIRCIDLRLADLCDFSILHIDREVYSTGTWEEFTLLNRRKVPILMHVEQGKAEMPDWCWGAIPHQHVFSEWDDLLAYIRHVAYSPPPIDTYNRWRFIDYGLLYNKHTLHTSKGIVCKISPEDHDYLSQWSWCVAETASGLQRAQRKETKNKSVYMHQDVVNRCGLVYDPKTHQVDHIDRNGMNNTRGNLRIVTRSCNAHNRGPQANNTSGVKGIYRDGIRYVAEIKVGGKKHFVGRFDTLDLAKAARDAKGFELLGADYHGD
jgi:hypothetical protein